MGMHGFLKEVISLKEQEVAACKSKRPLAYVREEAEQPRNRADFKAALEKSRPGNVGIIAEIKKASPSKGDINPGLDPALYADSYTKAGACAVSVLTEGHYFKGSLKDLKDVVAVTSLPVLRKDFTISSYQIYEAGAAGAGSILLITAILSKERLKGYIDLTRELGMEPLVEIISEKEFETASQCDATVIGINNRNLMTLEVDRTVSKRLAPLFFEGQIPIEASGIASSDDIRQGLNANFFNFLVGESIVRAADTKAFIRGLIETQ